MFYVICTPLTLLIITSILSAHQQKVTRIHLTLNPAVWISSVYLYSWGKWMLQLPRHRKCVKQNKQINKYAERFEPPKLILTASNIRWRATCLYVVSYIQIIQLHSEITKRLKDLPKDVNLLFDIVTDGISKIFLCNFKLASMSCHCGFRRLRWRHQDATTLIPTLYGPGPFQLFPPI